VSYRIITAAQAEIVRASPLPSSLVLIHRIEEQPEACPTEPKCCRVMPNGSHYGIGDTRSINANLLARWREQHPGEIGEEIRLRVEVEHHVLPIDVTEPNATVTLASQQVGTLGSLEKGLTVFVTFPVEDWITQHPGVEYDPDLFVVVETYR